MVVDRRTIAPAEALVECYHPWYLVIIMMRTQVSLDAEMYREARAEARRQGISLAELFRRALAAALPGARRAAKKPWLRFSGVIADGAPDESDNEHIDREVYGRAR